MKKIAMILAVGLVSISLAISQAATTEVKKEAAPENSNISNLKLAYDLADYGYKNDSASALLQAAEIIASVPKQKADVEAKLEGTSVDNPEKAKSDYSVDSLIADAKKLAGKDKNLLAWAKNVEKAAKKSTRGASSGALYDSYFAYANGGTTYYDWFFDANRVAEVGVHSLDGADLDLYIYDENGNLIIADTGCERNAYCSFKPYFTTKFRVIVKNNARYNATFEIVTN
ncbi:MAG: hypothetical protein VZR56_08310 [Treponema sp.]|nr:hypothetical protein [Treponema sp.]